jgi:NDP-sugar pyrophosphorylase family protein
MKAMILAAGFGTRLFPLTIDRTKPAIPFLGKPLVGYVAEYIAGFGIRDIIVNLHHQPQSVMEALGDGSDFGVHIEYSREEPEILGTAGALDNARHLLGDEPFLIVNGKIISDIDIAAAVETHKRSGALATMVLKPNVKRERFTIIETEDGFVNEFGGFPQLLTEVEIRDTDRLPSTPLMFTGIHILEPRVFDYIPRGQFSDIVMNIYRPALAAGDKIAAHVSEGNWYEISTIPRYLDISLAMMGETTIFTGENCAISPDAAVRDSVFWDNVTIMPGASLYRTIVADGVTVKENEQFENSAIVLADMVRNCDEIPEKSLRGYFQDQNFVVPFS